MYKHYKVKPLIFAGRKETLQILLPLINSNIIDEIIVGLNTKNQDDLNFIHEYSLCNEKIKLFEIPSEYIGNVNAYIYMFSHMQDRDTIYIKMDDDLIYLSPMFFEHLLEFRVNHPDYICIYPFVINNPLCNYLGGWFNHTFNSQSDCMFNTWNDPKYAYILLNAFVDGVLTKSNIDLYEFDNSSVYFRPEIGFPICPSINAICFYGADCLNMNWPEKIKLYGGDEGYLTNGIFADFGTKRKHVVIPSALCVHYAFFTQRATLNKSGILKKYQQIQLTI